MKSPALFTHADGDAAPSSHETLAKALRSARQRIVAADGPESVVIYAPVKLVRRSPSIEVIELSK